MRYNYLDFARGILMSLGIVIHTAQAFSPIDWRVNNPESSIIFVYLIDFLHSFRMPSFFIIAGFFAAMLLSRNQPEEYLKTRFVRLGVPLLFCGISINSIIHLLSHENYRLGWDAFTINYWLNGGWLDHLWFLVNLLVYITLLAASVKLYPKLLNHIKSIRIQSWHLFVAIPLAIFLMKRVAWRLPESPMGNTWFFVSMSPLFEYAPLFLLGVIFYLKQDLFLAFLERRSTCVGFITVFLVLYALAPPTIQNSYAYELFASLALLGFISLLFNLFKTYFNGNSKAIRNISDSSYTIYLVHPPIILALVMGLSEIHINIYAKYLLIVAITWCASYYLHFWLVSKFGIMSFLMNGKSKKLIAG